MKRIAETTLITLFSLIIFFHIFIITGLIPSDIVWGSRLSSQNQLIVFESISIFLNGFFLIIMLMKVGLLKAYLSPKVIKGVQWGMIVLFLLNTLGNLASENSFEKMVFTPMTLILSIFLLISVLSRQGDKPASSL
jgi:hypothetical protein